jgi:hypothetical protein
MVCHYCIKIITLYGADIWRLCRLEWETRQPPQWSSLEEKPSRTNIAAVRYPHYTLAEHTLVWHASESIFVIVKIILLEKPLAKLPLEVAKITWNDKRPIRTNLTITGRKNGIWLKVSDFYVSGVELSDVLLRRQAVTTVIQSVNETVIQSVKQTDSQSISETDSNLVSQW